MKQPYKEYYAFISYRHADNIQQGRQWATWLHQALETYQVPQELIGTENTRGETIPEKIYPVFRDEDELPADANLGSSIQNALEHSKVLIVLCSPNAVASTYVAEEIQYFKKLGHSDKIIAAILDGEPNVSWDTQKLSLGFEVNQECFPQPLQFEYSSDGEPTGKRAEPIAADFRVNINGNLKQSFTNSLALKGYLTQFNLAEKELKQITEQYEEQRQLMLLKIIAGILGVPLGELTQRDKAYQLQLEQQRAKRLRRWLAGVAALAIIAVGAGILAYTNQQQAVKNEMLANLKQQEAEQSLAEAYAGYGRQAFEEKRFVNANVYFSYATELNPDSVSIHEKSIAFAEANRLTYRRSLGLHFDSAPYISPNNRFAAGIKGDTIILFDLQQNVERFRYSMDLSDEYFITVSSDGNKIFLIQLQQQQFSVIDTIAGKRNTFDINSDDQSLILFPGKDDGSILVLDIGFNLHKYNLSDGSIQFTLPAEMLWENDAALLSTIEESLIDGLGHMKGLSNDEFWFVYTRSGTVIKIPFNANDQSDVEITGPLTDQPSPLFQTSNDGQLFAQIPMSYCLFELEDGSDKSTNWAVILDEIKVFNVSTGKLIREQPLNLSKDPSELLNSPACDKENYTEVLSPDEKSIAIELNNASIKIDAVQFNRDNQLELVTLDGVVSATDLISSSNQSRSNNISFSTNSITNANQWLVARSENVLEALRNQMFSNGDFSIYPVRDSDKQHLHTKLAQSEESMNISASDIFPSESWLAQDSQLTISHDQRFVFGVTPHRRLNVYSFASGELIKSNKPKDILVKSSDLICPSRHSHELYVVNEKQVTLYNWISDSVIFEKAVDIKNAYPVDCDLDVRSGELALAYLNMQFSSSDTALLAEGSFATDDDSAIVLVTAEQDVVMLSEGFSERLFFPTKVNYSKNGEFLFVGSALYNGMKINRKDNKLLSSWSHNSRVAVTDMCELNSGEIAVGHSDGSVYIWDESSFRKVLQLPLPIISTDCFATEIHAVSGYNKNGLLQDSIYVNVAEDERASEIVQYSVTTAKLQVIQKLPYIAQQAWILFMGNEWLTRSLDDSLSRYQPKQITARKWYLSSRTLEKWFYASQDSVLQITQVVDEIIINRISSGGDVDSVFEGRFPKFKNWIVKVSPEGNWLFFITYKNQDQHQVWLINLEDTSKAFEVTQQELALGEKYSLMNFSNDNEFVICMKTYCDLIDLNSLLTESIDAARRFISFETPIKEAFLTKESLITLTDTGVIQLFDKEKIKDKTVDNFDVTPDKILDNGFYRYLFKKDQNTLITSNMKNTFEISADDLSVTQKLTGPLKGKVPVLFDSENNFALFIDLKVGDGTVPASLFDLTDWSSSATFPLDAMAIYSLKYQQNTGTLFWTNNGGDLNYTSLLEEKQNSKFENAEFAELLSGYRLQGVDLLESQKLFLSQAIKQETSPAYMQNSRINKIKAADDNILSNLDDPRFWLTDTTVNVTNTTKSANLKSQIVMLEETILGGLLKGQVSDSSVEKLKSLDEDNYYIQSIESFNRVNQSPFSVYLALKQLTTKMNNQVRYAGLLNLVRSNFIKSAILSRQTIEAYSILMMFPQAMVEPNLKSRLVFDLFNLGYYGEAKALLKQELNTMRSYGLDQPGHQNHQWYKQAQDFLQHIESFIDIRLQVSLPAICVGGIQQGSLFEYSGWQDHDCIVKVDGQNFSTTDAIWKATVNLVNQGGGKVTVIRKGAVQAITVKPPLQGAAWRQIGYPGESVLKIQAITNTELAAAYDLRVDDLLIQMDDHRLVDRSVLLHLADTGLIGKTLYLLRPDSGVRRQSPNKQWQKLLGDHPVIYLSGELIRVELTSDQPFGVNMAETSILSSVPPGKAESAEKAKPLD